MISFRFRGKKEVEKKKKKHFQLIYPQYDNFGWNGENRKENKKTWLCQVIINNIQEKIFEQVNLQLNCDEILKMKNITLTANEWIKLTTQHNFHRLRRCRHSILKHHKKKTIGLEKLAVSISSTSTTNV